jgi:hypothetical protein
MGKLSQKELIRFQNDGIDLALAAKVQPQGSIKFKTSKFAELGDGYVACLTVIDYPTQNLPDFWLNELAAIENVILHQSIGTENRQEMIKTLQNSTGEKSSQISGKAKEIDNLTAMNDYQQNINLMNDLMSCNGVMKRNYVRLFVYDDTIEGLEKRIKEIREEHGQFKMTILQDEQVYDWQAPFTPTMKQVELDNKRIGTPISVRDLGGSYFFNHTKLDDPNGSYFGYTSTNGAVNFDFFHRDNKRTRSFMLVCGNSGMGKSTFLMKTIDDNFARGNFIRNFDVSHEYLQLTRSQRGIVMNLSGGSNRINPFQVFPTSTSPDGSEVDEIASFQDHLEKLKSMLTMLNTNVSSDDLIEFDNILTMFYIERGMWQQNPQLFRDKLKVTKLKADQYPILSDFVIFLDSYMRKLRSQPHSDMNRMNSVNRIYNVFNNLLSTKAEMFNGVTNFPNIANERVVTFDISSLKSQGMSIFNAQVYSILSMLSADIVNNGKKYRALVKQGKIHDEYVPRYVLNVDEAENLITPNFPKGVEFFASLMEQMRKNYCGLIMAMPSIKGVVFNNNGSETDSPYMTAVKKIFGLLQYRAFFQMSDDDIPLLANAMGSSMNLSELENLPHLDIGEVCLNISGQKNVVFHVQPTPEELRRYDNGRG